MNEQEKDTWMANNIDKKGGKYRIINCFPSEEPQDSIIKTVKTNYKLSN